MTAAKAISPELETYFDLQDRVMASRKQNDELQVGNQAVKAAFEKAGVEDHFGVTLSRDEGRILARLMFAGAGVTQQQEDLLLARSLNEQVNDYRNSVLSTSVDQAQRYLDIAGAALTDIVQLSEQH